MRSKGQKQMFINFITVWAVLGVDVCCDLNPIGRSKNQYYHIDEYMPKVGEDDDVQLCTWVSLVIF